MFDAQEVGDRVRQLRVATGLDQTQLAQRVGVVQGAISRIENGLNRPTDDILVALAGALDCRPDFLAAPLPSVPPTRPWLRAYADAPKRDVDQQLAQCAIAIEATERLSLRTLPDAIPIFNGADLHDDEEIEQFALEVREAAGIPPSSVVGNTTRAAERLGCIVLPMSGELGRHLGLSTVADLQPVICVSRPATDPARHVPGDRQRHTIAHELGHLSLHRDLPPPATPEDARRIERQAHRFAGAFLIPGDALANELDEASGRVTLKVLAAIKERWGVAIKALVMRCRQLGIIDDDHARSLYKQISSRGWNKAEPVYVGNERAIWLSKALDKAMRPAPDAIDAAVEASGLGRSYFENWTNWDPIDAGTDAAVIGLPQRQADDTATSTTGDPAPVTKLHR
jgi:Zn-dependent peptidase ImmA (M78 family)/DNA-binding XRE family transcriptional regulator